MTRDAHECRDCGRTTDDGYLASMAAWQRKIWLCAACFEDRVRRETRELSDPPTTLPFGFVRKGKRGSA